MRQIYLMARREYLSYVATWGFWLSIAMVPVFMSVGIFAPMLAERAAPTRYYAVITDEPALEAELAMRIDRGRRNELRAAVRGFARVRGVDAALEEQALAAFDEAGNLTAGLSAATDVLGLPGASAIQIPEAKLIKVVAPTRDAEALRAYLMGDLMVETPGGPQPLYAAIFLRRGTDAQIEIDYWSAALTNNDLADIAERAMRDFMRREALARAGVDLQTVERANGLNPKVTELNPERTEADAEVTMADRLPFIVGAMLGFGLWMVIFSVVNMLLSAVVEEKGNKILESLLAHASYREILIGKLLGVAGVSATLLSAWGGFGLLGVLAAANAGFALPDGVVSTLLNPGMILPFVGYFVFGYLMYGAIFLAIGSLCETIQEAQTLMSPMIFILMVPMLILPIALRDPDSPFVIAVSWIPLYTPFTMMARLPSDPPLFDVLGTSVLLVVSTGLILWAAGGVFRAGVTGRAGPDVVKRAFARLLKRTRSTG